MSGAAGYSFQWSGYDSQNPSKAPVTVKSLLVQFKARPYKLSGPISEELACDSPSCPFPSTDYLNCNLYCHKSGKGIGNFVLNAHVSIKIREFKSNTDSDYTTCL